MCRKGPEEIALKPCNRTGEIALALRKPKNDNSDC